MGLVRRTLNRLSIQAAAMNASTDKPMNVHLPEDVAGLLDQLSQATGSDKSSITVAALRDYLEAQAWQIQDIEQGVAEADRGEFAPDSEVNSVLAKYGG